MTRTSQIGWACPSNRYHCWHGWPRPRPPDCRERRKARMLPHPSTRGERTGRPSCATPRSGPSGHIHGIGPSGRAIVWGWVPGALDAAPDGVAACRPRGGTRSNRRTHRRTRAEGIGHRRSCGHGQVTPRHGGLGDSASQWMVGATGGGFNICDDRRLLFYPNLYTVTVTVNPGTYTLTVQDQ